MAHAGEHGGTEECIPMTYRDGILTPEPKLRMAAKDVTVDPYDAVDKLRMGLKVNVQCKGYTVATVKKLLGVK